MVGGHAAGHVDGSGGGTGRLGQRAGEVLPGRPREHVGASAQIIVVPVDVETRDRVTAAAHRVALDSETRLEDITEHHLTQRTRRVMHGQWSPTCPFMDRTEETLTIVSGY